MISENQKLRVCVRIRDELPSSFGRLLLHELDDKRNHSIPTTCPWKESFQFRWELYFYLFLAHEGYTVDLFKGGGPPTKCVYHPWSHGLVFEELLMLSNVSGRLEEIWLETGVNPEALNDIVDDYRSCLMEWHDEEAAMAELDEQKRERAREVRAACDEFLGEGPRGKPHDPKGDNDG
jgi:hypothetical protein